MNNIYDYENNITIKKDSNGNLTVKMNEEILTSIIISLYEGSEYQEKSGRIYSSKETKKLIAALSNKSK